MTASPSYLPEVRNTPGTNRNIWGRTVCLTLVAALIGGACGGSPEIYETPPGASAAESELTLPAPVPATPAFALTRKRGFPRSLLKRIEKTKGVAALAPVARSRIRVTGPKGPKRMTVASVRPLEFRPVAPASTRDAEFVWLSLLAGEVVTTFDAAKDLGLRNGGEVRLPGAGTLNVAGFADNGTPNIADLMVQAPPALDAVDMVVVGAESGVTIETLASDLEAAVPGVSLKKLIPSGAIRVTTTTQAPAGFAPVPGGLHPAMAEAVSVLISAAEGRVWVNSGYRSTAHQAVLWQGALEKYGDPEVADNWVAPPGHSMHERGLAVDLGGDLALAARLVEQLGLPLWRPMSWEPWHWELSGSRG